jgi:hypothetical protein
MNIRDRKKLQEAVALLEELAQDERNKFDNMTEGLQATEQGQKIEAAADALDEALGSLQEIE